VTSIYPPVVDGMLDAAFCEVPHVIQEALAPLALERGAKAVTVYPYTGWGCIWPFLDAGLVVYVYRPPPPFPAEAFRRILRGWQQKARRKYGTGRVLLWRGVAGG
jgi:hypothetical protein